MPDKLQISLNGPLPATALQVAYKMYSDIHPTAPSHLDLSSSEFASHIEVRIKSVAGMAVSLLAAFYDAMPEKMKSIEPPASGQPV